MAELAQQRGRGNGGVPTGMVMADNRLRNHCNHRSTSQSVSRHSPVPLHSPMHPAPPARPARTGSLTR